MYKESYKILGWAIHDSNYELAKKYWDEINTLISKKKNLPYTLVENLFKLMVDINRAQDAIIQGKSLTPSRLAAIYFQECDGGTYNYHGKKKITIDGKSQFRQYDIYTMFYFVFYEYYLQINIEPLTPINALLFLFEQFKRYANDFFSKEDLKDFSHYKIGVVAAYSTRILGVAITNEKSITNKKLFDKARRHIEHLK